MTQYCAKIAIIGQPNVGKSTLLNSLTAKSIAITSPKPQTTEVPILGILTESPYQFIFIDTPGIHERIYQSKNRSMNRHAKRSILDADLILWLITPYLNRQDYHISEWLKQQESCPPLCVLINKSDLPHQEPALSELTHGIDVSMFLNISAKTGFHVEQLKAWLLLHCPEGAFLFNENESTTQSEDTQITEIIREQLLLKLNQEIPYQCQVGIESDRVETKGRILRAYIEVQDLNHKKMIIGNQGRTIKAISQGARQQMQKRLGIEIHLMLFVKCQH